MNSLRALLVLQFVLITIASWLPRQHLWGLNHLAYYPVPLRLLALAIIAASFIPVSGSRVYDRAMRLAGRAASRSEVVAMAAAFVGLVVFVSAPAATFLLGDGYLQASLLDQMARADASELGRYIPLTIEQFRAPLTVLMNVLAAKAAMATGAEPIAGMRLWYAALGGALVFVMLTMLQRDTATLAVRVLAILAVLLSGAIELFFGYIELYTPVVLVSLVYVVSAYRAVSGRGSPVPPFALLVLATACHVQALVLLPSLVFVVLRRLCCRNNALLPAVITLALTLAGIVAICFVPVFAPHLLPFAVLLSPRHILDIFNVLVLVVPAAFLLAGLVITAFPGPAEPDGAFALVVFAPASAFLWLFDAKLGAALDWDLFALSGLAFWLPGVVALRRAGGDPAMKRRLEGAFAPVLVICAVMTLAWVGINAGTARSVSRFENLLEHDTTHGGYGYEILAMHHRTWGDLRAEMAALEAAYERQPNPRYLLNIGQIYVDMGDGPNALRFMRAAYEAAPDNDVIRRQYVDLLATLGEADEQLRVCRAAIETRPEEPFYHYYLGQALYLKGMDEEALAALERCMELKPPSVIVQAVGEIRERIARRTPRD